jgi:tricorn protease-like protein
MDSKYTKLGALVIAVTIAAAAVATSFQQQQNANAFINPNSNFSHEKAPVVVSGNNIYVAWDTDKGTPNKNSEVMFRVSTDGGKTFSDKINLSNSTNADSINQEIDVDENTIAVTWWEHNQTANVPVMRISTDNGKTFGPILKLATNGTIGTTP